MLVKADVSWGKGNVCRKGDRSNVIALDMEPRVIRVLGC